MAASMSLDRGNTDKLYAFRAELQRLCITLLPPDVNRSGVNFTVEPLPTTDDQEGGVEKSAIRYALAALKNVGSAAMEALVAERTATGPFTSLLDFASRLDMRVMNNRHLENLARPWALHNLNPNRPKDFQSGELVIRTARAAQTELERPN